MVSLFRQGDRIGSLSSLSFFMSGGSKHQQAELAMLTLPPRVLGTFKLRLAVLAAAVTEFEL